MTRFRMPMRQVTDTPKYGISEQEARRLADERAEQVRRRMRWKTRQVDKLKRGKSDG